MSEDAIESNWFGTEMNENESILFYAFVENEKIDSVFNAIDEFNAKQETLTTTQNECRNGSALQSRHQLLSCALHFPLAAERL